MDENKKKVQEMYMEFQMLSQQLQQSEKQIHDLKQQVNEVNATKQAIEELGKTETGKEILVPVSNGIFVKGELKENKELIINVGSNTAVTKSIPDAQKLMDEQKEELLKYHKDLIHKRDELNAKVSSIQKEMKTLVG